MFDRSYHRGQGLRRSERVLREMGTTIYPISLRTGPISEPQQRAPHFIPPLRPTPKSSRPLTPYDSADSAPHSGGVGAELKGHTVITYYLCRCSACAHTAHDESGGNSGLLWEFDGKTLRRVRNAIVREHLGFTKDAVWPAIAPQWRDCILGTYPKEMLG